jgi:hypothetical protein
MKPCLRHPGAGVRKNTPQLVKATSQKKSINWSHLSLERRAPLKWYITFNLFLSVLPTHSTLITTYL